MLQFIGDAVLFIGDVHNKYSQYKKIMKLGIPTIQVGDLGMGFMRTQGQRCGEMHRNPHYDAMVFGGHRFIRGNHDNPGFCRRHSQWIKDGTVENDMMFCGGAQSVDRSERTEGYDWWPDEELSISELYKVVDIFEVVRPRVMVTHDCPEDIARVMEVNSGRRKLDLKSVTRQAFQCMWETHGPEIWIFGHWHHSFDKVIGKTRFVCLAELEYKDIEV